MSEMVNGGCNNFMMSMCGSLGGGGSGASSSPYKYAVKNGYTGTEEEFSRAFVGICSNATVNNALRVVDGVLCAVFEE